MTATDQLSDAARESRRLTAEVLLDVAKTKNKRITIGDGQSMLVNLFDDEALIGSLLKIALFSVGAQGFSDMTQASAGPRAKGAPLDVIPTGMIALSFGYAIQVTPEEKTEILKHARRLERRFGPIPLDPHLMSEIASLAREQEK